MYIEPELMYCPQCNAEYRAEIVVCAPCQVNLISGKDRLAMQEGSWQQLQSRKGTLQPDDDIVTIHKAPLADIKRLTEKMEAVRIGTLVAGDESTCKKGCCPTNYFLQVRREDAKAAFNIIEEDHHRNTAIHAHDLSLTDAVFDTAAAEALCPACGCRFSTSTTTCPECGLCFA